MSSDATVEWTRIGHVARSVAGTPCFAFSEPMARAALDDLHRIDSTLRIRHWLSLKTQPIARLVDAARSWGLGVEVVSEFELVAALTSNVPPTEILVNGVGKALWLRNYPVAGLTVHLDSLAEVDGLAHMSTDFGWRIGLRCAIPQPVEGARSWDQFGLSAEEVSLAAARLEVLNVAVRGLHFHMQTNVANPSDYRRALEYVRHICGQTLRVNYIDIGGGLPVAERPNHGPNAAGAFDMNEFHQVIQSIPAMFPTVNEVWLENGRFLTGPAGALVVTVLDKKERDGRTYLICDGGRVNHARLAATERHEIVVAPNRGGRATETIVCGPTCGAVDRLGCWRLSALIEPGDMIIWLNAGAYHIPLETRFSFGRAPIVWFNENNEPEVVRRRETPAEWWQP